MAFFKLLSLASGLFLLLSSLTVAHADTGTSKDFQYFGGSIDYWHESKPKTSSTQTSATAPKKKAPESVADAKEPFQWGKFTDPKNKEFFQEGDYTPPEPFMEIMRHPTDDNLKMWFAYIEKKNELTNRLQSRLREYVAKNGFGMSEAGRNYLMVKANTLTTARPNAKRIWFRFYFDSHCPHCHRMFGTLRELQSQGYYIEARQVDQDPRGLEGLPVSASRVTPAEVRAQKIESVPLLLIIDDEKKAIYRLTGYQSTDSIFQALPKEVMKP
jgi:hypothetical protein